jgi:beta-glucosidase
MKRTHKVLLYLFALIPSIIYADPVGGNPDFARGVGHEGTVLLKNNGILPLAPGTKIALFGCNQRDYVKGGGGSGDVNVPYTLDLAYGLHKKEEAGKVSLYAPLFNFYWDNRNDYRNGNDPAVPVDILNGAAQFASTAIITFGRYSYEGDDRTASKGDYYLSDSEQTLVNQVIGAGFQHIVVVLNVGSVVDSEWFKNNAKIDAVLLPWQGGMEGGNTIADILTGDAYPSGKLTDTFAKNYGDYPSSSNFNQSLFVNYEEDIYVGYRYFETIPGAKKKVNYEFGFGLSYTTFSITGITAKAEGDYIVVNAVVKNTGSRPGKEVVQVYFSAPQGKLGKPAKELAAFLKTGELAPGESQAVTLSFPVSDMSSYDDLGKVFDACYVLEKGKYKFYIGNSVRNVKETAYQYTVATDTKVQQLAHRVAPKLVEKRLTASGKFESLLHPTVAMAEPANNSTYQKTETVPADNTLILLQDVYNNSQLMPAFLEQLTDEELILLSGGRPNDMYSNTNGMGFLSRLGIPNVLTADGPAGLRIETTATSWPCATLQACTWNPALVEEVGKRVGDECLAYGIGIWLAPGMNIHRNPLNGRNFEYYSEDPLVCGKIAAALTQGVQSKKVSITLKHFVCNNREKERTISDSRVSERALREIYLKGFEIAVKESDPWSIMSSYNLINGTETAENYELITNILHEEWGYQGMVMTDWGNDSRHDLEAKAGNDVKMPSGEPDRLREALKNGSLTRAELSRNIERLLNMILKTHTFASYQPFPITAIQETTLFRTGENIIDMSGGMRPEPCRDWTYPMVKGNLAWCDAGQWTEYDIDVMTAGTYELYPRIASDAPASGALEVQIDGVAVASFTCKNTGGWQSWETLSEQATEFYLPAGKHRLKVVITANGINNNLLIFKLKK